MRINYLIAFMLGVIACLLAVLVFGNPPATLHAQTADDGGGFVVATANTQPGAKDILWLLNATERGAPRLCVYEVREGRMALLFSRNVTYDFMYDQFPGRSDSQSPSVEEVFKETKKKREDERKAPTGGAGEKPK